MYHTTATGGSKEGSAGSRPTKPSCVAQIRKKVKSVTAIQWLKTETLRFESLYPTASQSKPYHLGKKFLLPFFWSTVGCSY